MADTYGGKTMHGVVLYACVTILLMTLFKLFVDISNAVRYNTTPLPADVDARQKAVAIAFGTLLLITSVIISIVLGIAYAKSKGSEQKSPRLYVTVITVVVILFVYSIALFTIGASSSNNNGKISIMHDTFQSIILICLTVLAGHSFKQGTDQGSSAYIG